MQVCVGLRLMLKVVPCATLALVEPYKLVCGGLRLLLKIVSCSLLSPIGFKAGQMTLVVAAARPLYSAVKLPFTVAMANSTNIHCICEHVL